MEVNEPITAFGKKKFTIQEYLEFEKSSLELEEYKSLTGQLSLVSVQVIIPVADIYERTKIPETFS